MRASLCKSSAAFLWLGPSDNGAESGPELWAWENVKGGMCGGNTVCPDDTPESALCPFPTLPLLWLRLHVFTLTEWCCIINNNPVFSIYMLVMTFLCHVYKDENSWSRELTCSRWQLCIIFLCWLLFYFRAYWIELFLVLWTCIILSTWKWVIWFKAWWNTPTVTCFHTHVSIFSSR